MDANDFMALDISERVDDRSTAGSLLSGWSQEDDGEVLVRFEGGDSEVLSIFLQTASINYLINESPFSFPLSCCGVQCL